eukprot:215419-Chlamydomonas_euryale.AAC.13
MRWTRVPQHTLTMRVNVCVGSKTFRQLRHGTGSGRGITGCPVDIELEERGMALLCASARDILWSCG